MLLVWLNAISGDAQVLPVVIAGKGSGRGGEPLGGAPVLIEGLGISAGTAQSGTYTLTVPADKAKGQTVTLRRSEEHTSELQSQSNLVCRLLLEKKKKKREMNEGGQPQARLRYGYFDPAACRAR